MSDIELEFSTPQMCADDRCTGQIDTEGKCSECGSLAEDLGHSDKGQEFKDTSPPVDIEHRELCPDGGCIGVLGADGSCKECGRVGASVTSDPRLRGLNPSEDEDECSEDEDDECSEDEDDECSEEEDDECSEDEDSVEDDSHEDDSEFLDNDNEEAELAVDTKGDLPPDFADRRLCPDGSCIGVVSDDGRCPECGSVA